MGKVDLVWVKLTEKDSNFFSNFPSILNNPEIYTTFLAFWITQRCRQKQRIMHFQLLYLNTKTFSCVMWCLLCIWQWNEVCELLVSLVERQWWWFWRPGWCICRDAICRLINIQNTCYHIYIANTCIFLASQPGRLHFLCRCRCL